MAYTQLIDVQYLVARSVVDSNVDTGLLNYAIIKAQDMHIQIILGENMYQSVMNQASTSTWNNSNYQLLVQNFIQPALMEWAIYEGLPFLTFKLTNKTVVQQTSDHSTAANISNVDYLRNIYRHTATWYTQRIREQIANNPDSYPEYYTQIGIERISPRRTTYFSGIGLPKTPKIKRKPGYDSGCCDDPIGQPVNI